MRISQVVATLQDPAASQWGLVTTAQARIEGASAMDLRRAQDAGLINRIRRGVWSLPGAPGDQFQELRAAWLSTDPEHLAYQRYDDPCPVVVTGATAAWLHGIGDLPAEPYEFSSPERRQSRQEDLRFHRRSVAAEDLDLIHGLPVGGLERTIADLVIDGHDLTLVADAAAAAAGIAEFNLLRLDELLTAEAPGKKDTLMDLAGLDAGASVERIIGATPASRLAANLGYSHALTEFYKSAAGLDPRTMTRMSGNLENILSGSLKLPTVTADLAPIQQIARQAMSSSVAPALAEMTQYSQALRAQIATQITASLPDPSRTTRGNSQTDKERA